MYTRAARFNSRILSGTPAKVGPSTYIISDGLDNISRRFEWECVEKDSDNIVTINTANWRTPHYNIRVCRGCRPYLESPAPFNTSAIRKTSFVNKSTCENPSPNKYKICFRKIRIVGGTSLQNKAPRIKYKTSFSSRGPYPTKEAKRTPGKVHVGVPPRAGKSTVTSIPEKGARGYEITSEGPIKIFQPLVDKVIGPATYYNPEGHHNFTTLKYKGNFWSLMKAKRFQHKEEEGPSPADYDVDDPPPTEWLKNQYILRTMNVINAPLLRTLDMMERKNCRENLPGPGHYSPKFLHFLKCQWGKNGTFSTAKRKDLYEAQTGPGPAEYLDPRSALKKPTFFSEAPFNVSAQRFVKSKGSSPGPSDYEMKNNMWDEIQKKGHLKYSSAPFDSSAVRKMLFINPDVACIPSPDQYFPQFQKKGDENMSSVFASKASKDSKTHHQSSPGPAAYSITDSFKTITTKKSHLRKTQSAFLMSGNRMKPLDLSSSPASNTYNLPSTTLRSNGRSFGILPNPARLDITPGPADYKINPKVARSSVYHTHNVTLKPRKPTVIPCTKTGRKTLRSFSTKKYITGHCSTHYD